MSSLQTFEKLVGKLVKEFADLLERVTDLTLQSCIKYLQTNFEKLVCKHVKKNPRHDVGLFFKYYIMIGWLVLKFLIPGGWNLKFNQRHGRPRENKKKNDVFHTAVG